MSFSTVAFLVNGIMALTQNTDRKMDFRCTQLTVYSLLEHYYFVKLFMHMLC